MPYEMAYAKKKIQEALLDSANTFFHRPLLPTEESAIQYAEVILFEIYGKDKIRDERPYKISLIDGYWVISGSLPQGYDGGTF